MTVPEKRTATDGLYPWQRRLAAMMETRQPIVLLRARQKPLAWPDIIDRYRTDKKGGAS